jgi:hypothetical protein
MMPALVSTRIGLSNVVMPLYTITLAFIFFVVSVERYRPAARRDCEPALNAHSMEIDT